MHGKVTCMLHLSISARAFRIQAAGDFHARLRVLLVRLSPFYNCVPQKESALFLPTPTADLFIPLFFLSNPRGWSLIKTEVKLYSLFFSGTFYATMQRNTCHSQRPYSTQASCSERTFLAGCLTDMGAA